MSKYQSRQWGKRAFAGVPIIKEEMVTSSKDFLAQIEREARIAELRLVWDKMHNEGLEIDDYLLELNRWSNVIADRIKELEKEE